MINKNLKPLQQHLLKHEQETTEQIKDLVNHSITTVEMIQGNLKSEDKKKLALDFFTLLYRAIDLKYNFNSNTDKMILGIAEKLIDLQVFIYNSIGYFTKKDTQNNV